MKRVAYSARARRDLAGIARYISDDDPAAAIRVMERIVAVIDGLRTFSTGRRSLIDGVLEKVVPDLPYIVFYSSDTNEISIITIRHTSRRPLG